METRCPLCQLGHLEELQSSDGQSLIQCSEYPACRFTTDSWDAITHAVARFHHPVMPGR